MYAIGVLMVTLCTILVPYTYLHIHTLQRCSVCLFLSFLQFYSCSTERTIHSTVSLSFSPSYPPLRTKDKFFPFIINFPLFLLFKIILPFPLIHLHQPLNSLTPTHSYSHTHTHTHPYTPSSFTLTHPK